MKLKVSGLLSVVIEWGKVGIFDGFRVFMEKLVGFNDYVMVLAVVVVWFVLILLANEVLVRGLNV